MLVRDRKPSALLLVRNAVDASAPGMRMRGIGGDGTSCKRTAIVFVTTTGGIVYDAGSEGGTLYASGWPIGCGAIGCEA
jgi:hypothetical protein